MQTTISSTSRQKKILNYDSCPAIGNFYGLLRRYKISTPSGSETWKNVSRSLLYLSDYLEQYEADKDVKFRTYLDDKVFDKDIVENDDAVPAIFRSTVESMFYHKRVLGNADNLYYRRALQMVEELADLRIRYAG